MRQGCAGPRGTGKPLQIAVDSVPGTTEATQYPQHRPFSAATRSTRLHVFVHHYQHPAQKQKHPGNNGMTPKHEGHSKDCNDETDECHTAISKDGMIARLRCRL